MHLKHIPPGTTSRAVKCLSTTPGRGRRSRVSTVTLSLSGTADGSGIDYTAGTLSTITIPANSTSATITLTLTPTNDEIVEGDEVVKVVGVSGDLAVSSAWITIEDDD